MPARQLEPPLTLPLRLWRGLTHVGNPLLGAHLRLRVRRGKEDAARLSERRGIATQPRPTGRLVWIHAASVGESVSVLPLIDTLLAADQTLSVLITTGTVTSANLLEGKLPHRAFHQYVPLDRVNSVRRFLDHWRPDAGVWVESELWPTLILESHTRGIPLALVNARMSKKSARGWQHLPKTASNVLTAFDVVLAQDKGTARRLKELGARNVMELRNLKLAAAPLSVDEAELAQLKKVIGDRPVWCAASTHKEEVAIGETQRMIKGQLPDCLAIIAPRQPKRASAVEDELIHLGLSVARRSRGDRILPETDIYLVDTIGEMGLVFRLARTAFMGRSFIDKGGSNPLEPAQLDCAILHGPHTDNFEELYQSLNDRGGSRLVADNAALADAIVELLTKEPARAAQAAAALTLVGEAQEVLSRTSDTVLSLMKTSRSDNASA
jgi:3-deoxy-D-manno-octulosonic-acid transferase